MTKRKQPSRIWIDPDHGKHPDDWTFHDERSLCAADHRKAGRLAYVPEGTDALAGMNKKIVAQRQEVARLTHALEATKNDLADIRAQRDEYRDKLRALGKL